MNQEGHAGLGTLHGEVAVTRGWVGRSRKSGTNTQAEGATSGAGVAAGGAEGGGGVPAERTDMLLAAEGGMARTAGSEARGRSWIEQLCERLIGSGR